MDRSACRRGSRSLSCLGGNGLGRAGRMGGGKICDLPVGKDLPTNLVTGGTVAEGITVPNMKAQVSPNSCSVILSASEAASGNSVISKLHRQIEHPIPTASGIACHCRRLVVTETFALLARPVRTLDQNRWGPVWPNSPQRIVLTGSAVCTRQFSSQGRCIGWFHIGVFGGAKAGWPKRGRRGQRRVRREAGRGSVSFWR